MKKSIFKILFLTLVVFAPVSAMAGVSVHVNIPLPPPIFFPAPPMPVVIPETNVYAVPDVQEDIFFSAGWWWRPWEGRWYRSRYYDRGWAYYRGVPSFHRNVPPGWRNDYRDHRWKGQPWEHQRVSHQDLQRNWRGWEKDGHWRRHGGPGSDMHRQGRPGGGPDMNRPSRPSGGDQPRRGGSDKKDPHDRPERDERR